MGEHHYITVKKQQQQKTSAVSYYHVDGCLFDSISLSAWTEILPFDEAEVVVLYDKQ